MCVCVCVVRTDLGKVVLEDGTAVVLERVEAGLGAHDPVLARVVIAHHVPRHERLASRRQLRQLKEQRVAVERHRILARDQLLHPRIVFHLLATFVVTFVERERFEVAVAVVITALTEARCRLCRRSGPGLLVLLVCERRPVRAARWLREDGVDGVGVGCSSVGVADFDGVDVAGTAGGVVVAVLVVDFGLASVAEGEAEDGLEVVRGAVVLDFDARALALGPRRRDQLPQVLALLHMNPFNYN